MVSHQNTGNPHLETDLWRWLIFDSGLSRRRIKNLILQNAQSSALSLFWQAGPEVFAQQLGLDETETAAIKAAAGVWPELQARWDAERRAGLMTLRINEPGYPAPLTRHFPPEERPLLLFLRGEPGLVELPMILPVAETSPEAEVEAWAMETLAELTEEGALALFMAQPGLHARLVQIFLDAAIPFALIIPQGLAAYEPPAGLRRALDEERVLLVSPFQPEWTPPVQGPNPLLPHAVAFARALASALLALTPLPTPPFPDQPCFAPPDAAPMAYAEPYVGPEELFLRLAESTAPSTSHQTPTSSPEPELDPITPEEILETLTQGGRVPPALAARLQQKKQQ